MSKTAFLFAGQGAQQVGMGFDLAEAHSTARDVFEQANDAIGFDLSRICFEGPEAELTRTENAQPAIYLTSWVAFQLLREQLPDLTFEAAAGLSLGEFTALAAAEAMSFEDGLKVVRLRGRFMQEACDQTKGGMAAIIGLEEKETRSVCESAEVEIANLNCPGQIVISGEMDKIAVACELAKERGAKRAMPLNVAGAYHSRLMASATEKLGEVLAETEISMPSVPVIANVDGHPHGGGDDIRRRLMAQVTGSVLFEQSIRNLIANGFTRFIELGPGTALTGFLRRIDKSLEVHNVGDCNSLEKTVAVLGG